MRILTFLHSLEAGGVERVALRLVEHWRAQGVDAPLFLGRPDGAMAHDIAARLAFSTPPQPGVSTARWETLWMISTLPGEIRRARPDVLFCAGNTYAVVAVALKLLLGRTCPPVIAKISNDLDRRDKPWCTRLPYRLWLRLQGRFLDHVVSMESAMAEEIQSALGISADAITVIPDPALSTPLIERLRAAPRTRVSPSGGRRFVAVGRLTPQKNLALMLRAFQRGSRAGDRLTVIGDGPQRSKLITLAGRLGIADKVDFLGYVPEPTALLPEFDILLLSSNYEGVPAVILEALAANLSIIATDCCRSMASLLQGGRLGELVQVGDEAMMASAIARARPGLQDERLSLAQAERFTLEHAAEAYLKVMAGLPKSPATLANLASAN